MPFYETWWTGAQVLWRYRELVLAILLPALGMGALWRAFSHGRLAALGWGWAWLGALAWVFTPCSRTTLHWTGILLALLGAEEGLQQSLRLLRSPHRPLLFLLAGMGLVVLPWNLSSVALLPLPPYIDSARHAFKIQQIFWQQPAPTLPLSYLRPRHFYHLIFHGITGWGTWLTHSFHPLDLTIVATVLVTLALPAHTYYLAWQIHRRPWIAALSGWASAAAWGMPFYALNWGKYPALLGLTLAPLLLAEALDFPVSSSGHNRSKEALLLATYTMLTFLAHARVGAIAAAIAWAIACYRWQEPAFLQHLLSHKRVFLLGGGLLVGVLVMMLPPKSLRFYTPWGAVLLAAGWLWSLTSQQAQQTFAPQIMGILILCVTALLPSPIQLIQPEIKHTVWIDRPLFEIVASLPLALWVGSLAGDIPNVSLQAIRQHGLVALIITGMVLLSWQHHYRPSSLVSLIGEDDLVAFALLKKRHRPGRKALVLTPRSVPDASAWVPFLLNFETQPVPENYWWRPDLLEQACNRFSEIWAYADRQPPGLALPPPLPWLRLDVALSTAQAYRIKCNRLPFLQKRMESKQPTLLLGTGAGKAFLP